ncbi:hypothetical protein D9619_007933 [Psilocybe cf. subviscida]|uniref:C2H2-type domain-containing protein n=1 Tax=Psilocybe cf. subviscida TaxID=2480587 RepID=A0A8H5AU77_9AGAR|nr:hypothetical protein D9619_007933 [Psilocybe cf. subviscida]
MVTHKTWLLAKAPSTPASSISGSKIPGSPDRRKHGCPHCRMVFTRSYDLKSHISQQHAPREEDFIRCILCLHVKIHTKQKSNLKLHLNGQHPEWLQELEITADYGVELCKATTDKDRLAQGAGSREFGLPIPIPTTTRKPKPSRAKHRTRRKSPTSEWSSADSSLYTGDDLLVPDAGQMYQYMHSLHLHDGTTVSSVSSVFPVAVTATQPQSVDQSSNGTMPLISLPPMYTCIQHVIDEAHLKNDNRTDDGEFICLWREKGDMDPCLDHLWGTDALIRHCEENHELSISWVSYDTNEPFARCQWDQCRTPPMLRSKLDRHVKEMHGGQIEQHVDGSLRR